MEQTIPSMCMRAASAACTSPTTERFDKLLDCLLLFCPRIISRNIEIFNVHMLFKIMIKLTTKVKFNWHHYCYLSVEENLSAGENWYHETPCILL